MEIRCLKSASRLLDRNCVTEEGVNKRGLDLFKEVLWVFVGHRATEVPTVKVGGQTKILPLGPAWLVLPHVICL